MENVQRLISVCHMLHATGKVSGSGGNVSIRAEGGFWITPTGVSLGDVTENNLVFLHADETYEGAFRPSKEFRMHLSCYSARPDITAVVHVHSLYAVALSCLLTPGDSIPAYFPGYVMRVNDLPMVPYLKPGCPELANQVSGIISVRNSVLLCNHGVVTVGTNLSQALNIMEEIEENAQLFFILGGKGHPMTREAIEELVHG